MSSKYLQHSIVESAISRLALACGCGNLETALFSLACGCGTWKPHASALRLMSNFERTGANALRLMNNLGERFAINTEMGRPCPREFSRSVH